MKKGFCKCGCGQKTSMVRGFYRDYVTGHNRRRHTLNSYCADKHGCWIWKGGFWKSGYGRYGKDRKTTFAHRAVYVALGGFIPTGMQLDHLCRNKACVNPDHLEVVSPAENTRRSRTAKLWKVEVKAIRLLVKDGMMTQRKIAEKFGVSAQTICDIVNGRIWRDVK